MSTGAAVRLSASGLGCPDWPQCSAADVVASKNAGQTLLNTWIEFGNRLLNFPLVIIAALIFIAAWRFRPDGRRRRDLVWLGAAQPLGVVAQAVIGGIVVLTKLNPAAVSVHFLVSAAVVAAAVALHMRCAALADASGIPETTPVRRDLRVMSAALVAVTCLMLTAGTVVTGTGPLAGDAGVPRYPLPLEGVTQFHADIGWLLAGLSIALVLVLRLSAAPRRAVRLDHARGAGIAGRHRLHPVLHPPPGRAGLGPRDRLRAGLDRRAAPVLHRARAGAGKHCANRAGGDRTQQAAGTA
jgi:cytochrome c oxidase assembly protein subunit 15